MDFRRIDCPKCGKRLMDASDNACGQFWLFCKQCRRTYLIALGGSKCSTEN